MGKHRLHLINSEDHLSAKRLAAYERDPEVILAISPFFQIILHVLTSYFVVLFFSHNVWFIYLFNYFKKQQQTPFATSRPGFKALYGSLLREERAHLF